MTKGVSLIDGGVDMTSSWWDNVINDYIRQVQVRVDDCHLLQAIVKPVTIIATALIIIWLRSPEPHHGVGLGLTFAHKRAPNSIVKLVLALANFAQWWVSCSNVVVFSISSTLRIWTTSLYWSRFFTLYSWRFRYQRMTPSFASHLSWRAFILTIAYRKGDG